MWTERSDLKITWSGESYTDARKAHDVLDEYIDEEPHREMLATVDHVALFSGSVTSQCTTRWRAAGHFLFMAALCNRAGHYIFVL